MSNPLTDFIPIIFTKTWYYSRYFTIMKYLLMSIYFLEPQYYFLSFKWYLNLFVSPFIKKNCYAYKHKYYILARRLLVLLKTAQTKKCFYKCKMFYDRYHFVRHFSFFDLVLITCQKSVYLIEFNIKLSVLLLTDV